MIRRRRHQRLMPPLVSSCASQVQHGCTYVVTTFCVSGIVLAFARSATCPSLSIPRALSIDFRQMHNAPVGMGWTTCPSPAQFVHHTGQTSFEGCAAIVTAMCRHAAISAARERSTIRVRFLTTRFVLKHLTSTIGRPVLSFSHLGVRRDSVIGHPVLTHLCRPCH